MTAPRVFLVEDDPSIRLALSDKLGFEGFDVAAEADGGRAWKRLASGEAFDLVLLDVMLPTLDGIEICRRMREAGHVTPVLMLTARGMESDRVLGLEIGADDYITKPFSARELVARLRAILRRQALERQRHAAPDGPVTVGDLVIDWDAFRVRRGDVEHDLSPTERDMLRLLVESAGSVVSRARFLDEIWGLDAYPSTRTVDFHVSQLRKKLERDPRRPTLITTVHGVGYRLERD